MRWIAAILVLAFAAATAPAMGQSSAGQSGGSGGATAANQAAEIAAIGVVGQRAVTYFDIQGQGTAANTPANGPIHDLGTAPAYSRINAGVFSTQAGTLILQGCSDSACANVYPQASQAVTAGGNGYISAIVLTRWWRAQFLNGATGGAINLISSATAN